MASASKKHSLSGVYPQRKKASSAVGKEKQYDKFSSTHEDVSIGGASIGGGSAQPAALTLSKSGKKDLNADYDNVENTLRQFDMNMAYGPCLGISRLERWERASRLGLEPPNHVRELLQKHEDSAACLWEGRV